MDYTAGKYKYDIVKGWAKCPKEWSLHDAASVSIDSQDRIYVFSRGDHPITIFDREGNMLASWGEGLFKRPHGLYVGPDGAIYCTDQANHTVSKFTPEGNLLLTLGNKDQPSDTGFTPQPKANSFYEIHARVKTAVATKKRVGPPFNAPTNAFATISGEIYVSDGYGNARIHRFSPDGKLLFSWGELGDGPGQLICPHSVWIDNQERVWVTDRENYRIQIFNTRGEYLDQWTDLALPCCVFIDNEEIVYVAEALCQRVSIFTIDGKLLARWYNQEEKAIIPFIAPHDIVVDSQGSIYVANTPMAMWGIDRGCESIVKFVRKT